MRVAVCGSIATDHLMTFPGRFADSLMADKLESISLSFLVDHLDVRRGGVGPNIAFGLGCLGLSPVLVGAVGADFAEYRTWLEAHGVDCSAVRISDSHHTARFVCTTDADQNQIASFYPGAMSQAREIDLGEVARSTGVDLVLVGADYPEAMLRHTRAARQAGVAVAADPSQQLASLDGEVVRELVDGVAYLFTNEYEAALVESRTGWSAEQLLSRVGTRVTTQGARGVLVERRDAPPVHVGVVTPDAVLDPTGVGDAFRAGFLAGIAWDLGDERSAQLGALLAAHVIETVGTQEYELVPDRMLERMTLAFGPDAAAAVAPQLPVLVP